MPGFTETSVYAALFGASGIPYPELLDRLVALGIERHEAEGRHRFWAAGRWRATLGTALEGGRPGERRQGGGGRVRSRARSQRNTSFAKDADIR